jgi:hypothetical protein
MCQSCVNKIAGAGQTVDFGAQFLDAGVDCLGPLVNIVDVSSDVPSLSSECGYCNSGSEWRYGLHGVQNLWDCKMAKREVRI